MTIAIKEFRHSSLKRGSHFIYTRPGVVEFLKVAREGWAAHVCKQIASHPVLPSPSAGGFAHHPSRVPNSMRAKQRSPKLPNQSCNRHHLPTNYRRESVRALARVSRWCCSCWLMPFWWASSRNKALFMLQTSAGSVKFCCSSCRIFFFSSSPLRAYDLSIQFTTFSTALSRSLTPITLILGFGFRVFWFCGRGTR